MVSSVVYTGASCLQKYHTQYIFLTLLKEACFNQPNVDMKTQFVCVLLYGTFCGTFPVKDNDLREGGPIKASNVLQSSLGQN